MLRSNADTRINDFNHGLRAVAEQSQVDPAARRRVFGSIGEQILDDLQQTGRISAHVQWLTWQINIEAMPACLEDPSRGSRGVVDDIHEIDDGLFERDLALRQSTNIEQIVKQPGRLPRLA